MNGRWPWAIGLLIAWRAFLSPPTFHDESWFLQVVTRTAAGEALYGDVFYNTTPLAVWLARPFHALASGELLGLRLLLALTFGLTLWFSARIARQAGARPAAWPLLASAIVGLQHFSYYTPISVAFLMACFSFTLSYRRGGSDSRRWLMMAALAAACAFLTKYNVGAAAFAAVLYAIAVNPRERARSQAAVIAVCVFASTAVLLLLPVASSWPQFADYALLNKSAYIRSGLASFRPAWETAAVLRGLNWWRALAELLFHSPLLLTLAPLTLAAIWFARGREGEERQMAVLVAAFVLAGVAILFPQLALAHLNAISPVLFTGLHFAASRLGMRRSLRIAGAAWLALAFLWVCARPIPQIARGQWRRMSEHPYSGMWINRDRYERFRHTVDALRASGANPFLLTYDAGSLYLTSGLTNPTPFDVPAGTAMGRHGEQQVMDAVESGAIRSVCVNTRWPGGNAPRRLIDYVERRLRRGESVGSCVMYWRD